MNKYLLLFICIAASYLIGTILFAYIITKIATGKDIRTIGNKNPGASNTMRSVGPIAGILVSVLDIFKSIIPLVLARLYLFKDDSIFDWTALFLIGMAVVLGHCRPFWMGFKKGGGGIASAIGVWAFFVPIEFAASLLLGLAIAYIFMRNAEFKFGRWTQMFAAVLTPIVILIVNLFVDIPLFLHFSIGGHSLSIVIGAFMLLAELLVLNSYELFYWLRDPNDKINPDRPSRK